MIPNSKYFIIREYCVLAPTLMSNYDFTLVFVIVVILPLLYNY